MFARILEFTPRMEKKQELLTVINNEVLPILKKQNGFLEFLPFIPETATDRWVAISLWNDKKDFERYEKQWFNKVEEIVRPFMSSTIMYRPYVLETTLCKHFEKTLVA